MAVANAKCKLIDLERKRKNTEIANSCTPVVQSEPANKSPRFCPTGKYAQKLSTLANEIISQKCQKDEKSIILPNQGQNDEKKETVKIKQFLLRTLPLKFEVQLSAESTPR